jgi:hypothetical protein
LHPLSIYIIVFLIKKDQEKWMSNGYSYNLQLDVAVSADLLCPNFAEVECPFFDVDNKNPSSRQMNFYRELDGFSV